MTDPSRQALIDLVQALARGQARIDSAAGVRWDAIELYCDDPSPENAALVVEHMMLAMDLAFNVRRGVRKATSRQGKGRAYVDESKADRTGGISTER
jgi:hypothetical protein